MKWHSQTLESVSNRIFTGIPPRSKATLDDGTDVVSVVGVRALTSDGSIDLASLDQFSISGQLNSKDRLRVGDVLLSIRGNLPKTAVVQSGFMEDTYVSGNLAVIRPDQANLDPSYLWSYLASICRQQYHPLLTRASTLQLSIRMSDLNRLAIPIPPLQEQRVIGQAAIAVRDAVLAQRQALSQGERTLKAYLLESFKSNE